MTIINQQAWDDWYDSMVNQAARCVVVIAPGTIGPEPVLCWLAHPLDLQARRMATSRNMRERAGLAIGVLRGFHKQCARSGVKPPAPLI